MRSEPTFVRADRLEALREALAKVAKRAAKLGVAPPTVSETGNTEVRERRQTALHWDGEPVIRESDGKVEIEVVKEQWVEVVVEGETPKLPGWRLVAVVDHRDHLVDVVPGEKLPTGQRDRGPVCDHCGRRDNRRRKTMVLGHEQDANVVQVGTTCIRDFLGSSAEDPLAMLAYAELLMDLMGDLTDYAGDDEGGFGEGYARIARVENVDKVLLWTAGYLEDHEWVSGSRAFEQQIPATRDAIERFVWPPQRMSPEERAFRASVFDAITDAHRAEVKAALAWVVEAAAQDPENDYLANCAQLVENGVAAAKRFGYLCSVLPSYRRHVSREAEKARRAARVSAHVGEVGDKLVMAVEVAEDPRVIEGQFGTTYLQTFVDDAGRVFKWFGSRALSVSEEEPETGNPIERRLARGDRAVIRGTVKRHGEFKGFLETQLTRVSLVATSPEAIEAARELVAAEGDLSRPADDAGMLALAGAGAAKFMKRAQVWRLK